MSTKRESVRSSPKLLIVDDDIGMRNQLKWGLDAFDVITADSRLNALIQFEKYHPTLVTLDLGLPPDIEGTDEGFAILEEIIYREPETKVFIISGSEDEGNAEKAKKSGAFGFYPKPVKLIELQRTIQKAYDDFMDEKK